MGPCQISDFYASPRAEDASYIVGSPAELVGSYGLTQEPACGYEETTSVTNLPAMIEHEAAEFRFRVNEQSDNANIGAYTITIRSEISVPDDATLTSFTPMVVEYDFTVFI